MLLYISLINYLPHHFTNSHLLYIFIYYTEMIYLIILRVPCAESCTRDPSPSSLSDVWPCAVVYVWLVRYWSLIIFIYGARGGCNFFGRGGKIELTFWMHGKPFFQNDKEHRLLRNPSLYIILYRDSLNVNNGYQIK